MGSISDKREDQDALRGAHDRAGVGPLLVGLPGVGDPVAADRLGGAARQPDLDRGCRVADRRGVPAGGDQRGGRGHRGVRRLEGLALHHGGPLHPRWPVGVHPARQHLLRAGLGAGADPDLLRRLRDHPGCRLAGGEPLLVGEPDHGDPADSAGVLGVGVRPGVRAGPADGLDPVLGGLLRAVPGLLPDLHGVHGPPRRAGGRRHRRCAPSLNHPVLVRQLTLASMTLASTSWLIRRAPWPGRARG